MQTPPIEELYRSVLAGAESATMRYFAALRARGIEPVPDRDRGIRDLYAPNPVLVPATVVAAMTRDANAFCAAQRARVPDAASLSRRAPPLVRDHFASDEVAERLIADLARAHPLTNLDAFLVETPVGLDRAYIEWQTVGSYVTLGRRVMPCIAEAWPELAGLAAMSATPGLSIDALGNRLRSLYTAGIEDDPRQGVVLDYHPATQVTRREFLAIQELTGGNGGMGIVDPREIVFVGGDPHYRRDGQTIPVRRIYSRLVYSDMQRLVEEASPEELHTLHMLFGEGTRVTWISHPLHFFYGSKADFPAYWERGLSPALVECRTITHDLRIAWSTRYGPERHLHGYVQKPTDLQGGRAVERGPRVGALRAGWVLQREIEPAASHVTLYGRRTPEVRVMCVPAEDGTLVAGLVFTRVKAPDVFLSNAGYTARLNIPGTGEGYGLVVDDTEESHA